MLGHPCDRRIWLDWKGEFTTPNQTLTLEKGKREEKFDRGRHEEDRLIKVLQGAGYLIIDRQKSFTVLDGNFKGHIDGIIFDAEGNQYILEIKSCQEKYFKSLLKNGVVKTFPSYYLQCQMVMHFFSIHHTLFLAVNKNNGEITKTILNLDEEAIENGLQKIHRIMSYGNDRPAALGVPHEPPPILPCQYCEFVTFCYKRSETPS
jgi:hypothetical protein